MKKFAATFILSLIATASHAADFTVTSPDYTASKPIANSHVFKGFGCEGENKSPALAWKGAPEGTKSYAVTVYDPDAPTGSGWWHWLVYNIPATVTSLETDASAKGVPEGAVQSRTDFGTEAYGGPCPPKGHKPHHYVVTVHALDVEKLDLKPDSSGALVGYMLNEHRIGKAELTSIYGR